MRMFEILNQQLLAKIASSGLKATRTLRLQKKWNPSHSLQCVGTLDGKRKKTAPRHLQLLRKIKSVGCFALVKRIFPQEILSGSGKFALGEAGQGLVLVHKRWNYFWQAQHRECLQHSASRT